jgi:RND family efflux transporter MFP subunit
MHPTIVLFALVTLLLSACGPQTTETTAETGATDEESHAESVNVPFEHFEVPAPATRPPLRLSAEVVSAPYVDLSFPINGTLMEVNLRAGRIVTPDLPAARLNPAPLREAIEETLQARTRALSAFTQAEGELRRQRLLFGAGSVGETGVLEAQELLQARQFNLDRAEQELAEARAAEAASSMSGGVNGVVREVYHQQGESIRAGQKLYTIETDSAAQAQFRLAAETDWVLREPIEIEVVSAEGLWQSIKVSQIQPAANDGTFIITLEGATEALREGDAISLNIRSTAAPSQIIVPFGALLQDQEGVYVIVLENGKKRRQAVQPSALTENGVALESGLSGGEILLVPALI